MLVRQNSGHLPEKKDGRRVAFPTQGAPRLDQLSARSTFTSPLPFQPKRLDPLPKLQKPCLRAPTWPRTTARFCEPMLGSVPSRACYSQLTDITSVPKHLDQWHLVFLRTFPRQNLSPLFPVLCFAITASVCN